MARKPAVRKKDKPALLAPVVMSSEAVLGRPALYKPEYVELGKRAALLGARNEDLARFFGVSISTIEAWLRDHEDFSRSVQEGKDFADGQVANAAFKRAVGYSHPAVKIMTRAIGDGESVIEEVPYTEHYPPDATTLKFWLTNRRPDLWRDRIEFDNKGQPLSQVINNDNRTQTVVNVNVEDAAKSYQDFVSRTRK